MRTLKIAMIGFGNAGRAFSRIILNKQREIGDKFGWELKIVAVATASRGSLVDEKGIDLEEALQDIEVKGKFDRNSSAFSNLNSMDIIQKVDYDVMIEITPLSIFTGQPAMEHISTALNRKKHVITANKGPIAWAYKELKGIANKHGVIFLHETTVMDGTPVFNLVEETLPMCKIKEVKGILNTTTNFVLGEMAKGNSFEDAIMEGKNRGFVEADPSLDIDGWDAAAKTAALINVLMDGCITPLDIKREGIQNITYDEILESEKNGKVIKLICHGWAENGKTYGELKPMSISKEHIFAGITGTSSILSIKTDLMGEITIVEQDPEIEQTGYGLFSDLMRLIRHI